MDPAFADSAYATELDFMFRIIRVAGQMLLAGKDTGHEVRYKSDNSIVTSLDHQCAAYLDGEIQAHFPGDGILNEETHPIDDAAPWYEAERCWVLDPLDSTSSFVRNGQHYGVILALTLNGRPQAGMTFKPELGELYFAVHGEGAHRAFVSSGSDPLQVLPVRVNGDMRPSLILSHGRQSPGLKELLHKLGDPHSHRMNGSLKIRHHNSNYPTRPKHTKAFI